MGHISQGGDHGRDKTGCQFEGVEAVTVKDDLAETESEAGVPLAGHDTGAHDGSCTSDERKNKE